MSWGNLLFLTIRWNDSKYFKVNNMKSSNFIHFKIPCYSLLLSFYTQQQSSQKMKVNSNFTVKYHQIWTKLNFLKLCQLTPLILVSVDCVASHTTCMMKCLSVCKFKNKLLLQVYSETFQNKVSLLHPSVLVQNL